MWMNISTWQIFSAFTMWRNSFTSQSYVKNFSTSQSVKWSNFSTWQIFFPQASPLVSVTNIRYAENVTSCHVIFFFKYSCVLIFTKSFGVFNGQDFDFRPCPISPQYAPTSKSTTWDSKWTTTTTTTTDVLSGACIHYHHSSTTILSRLELHSSSLLSVFNGPALSNLSFCPWPISPLTEANNNNRSSEQTQM